MPIQDRFVVRAFNGAVRGLQRLGCRIPSFDPDRVEQSARRSTGLSDFGPARYRAPLELLCQSYVEDRDLTPMGQLLCHGMLTHCLRNRLLVQRDVQADPGLRDEPIRRPLFVLGLPRTGTTLLFNLLAQDPACRPLMFWESMQPAPSPRPETYETDRRIAAGRYRMKKLNDALPELRHIHEFQSEGPEECLGLLMNAFLTPFFRGKITRYRQWLDDIPDSEVDAAYAEYQLQLQLLQRHVKGSHWILKCPSHLYGLGSLLRTFPDAAVVHTHRDLTKSVASLCSLSDTFEELVYHPVDPLEIGQRTLHSTGQLLGRGLRGRDAADPDGRRVLDIAFQDTVRQPLETVERIYAHFGYPFTPEFRQKVEQFLAEDAQRRQQVPRHAYTLEPYGLSAAGLRHQFRDYLERFQIAPEG
jgi:hypothetical protein